MTSNFLSLKGLVLHYLDSPPKGEPMLLLHSLSANAYVFQGLIANGLAEQLRLIIPDLRGRGQSSKALADYSLKKQAEDLIALLDHLQLETVAVCGHSFGGLLAIYFAAHYPERVSRLAILDAAVELNPLTPAMISVSTARLLMVHPSREVYLESMRKSPFINRWDAAMLPYLNHDVKTLGNGMVVPTCFWADAARSAAFLAAHSKQEWYGMLRAVQCDAVLIQATEPFLHNQFIVLDEQAERTATLLRRCLHLKAEGNHLTMLFGNGARQINAALKALYTAGEEVLAAA